MSASRAQHAKTQSQPLGISTGGLMARMSLVPGSAQLELVRESEFVFIRASRRFSRVSKKRPKADAIGLVRAQLDGINLGRAEHAQQFRLGAACRCAKASRLRGSPV